MLLTGRERILLHVHEKCPSSAAMSRVMPASLSQGGISKATAVARKHIPRNLQALTNAGLISESMAHIEGAAQRRRVYVPTPEGHEEARAVRKKALCAKIILKQGNERRERTLEQAIKDFTTTHPKEKRPGILLIHSILEPEGKTEVLSEERLLLELTEGEKLVKHLESAPGEKPFFGRKQEMEDILKIIQDKKMLVLYGITGIGKSALGAHLARNHKKSVFWHPFHEWDTLQNFLHPLARFLEDMGKAGAGLKSGDQNISSIAGSIREGLSGTEALIVLDDIQKAPQEFGALFQAIIAQLASMEKVKFLVLSREIPQFYSRRDVVVNKTVAEYLLEGLDTESCRAFLNTRKISGDDGISDKSLQKVCKLTSGHPLSLELIETPEHHLDPSISDTGEIDTTNLEVYFEEEIMRFLPEEDKAIFRQASVYRYPVPADGLLLKPGQEFSSISNLVRHALMVQTGGSEFYLHDLLKNFLYSRLSPFQRTTLHKSAGNFYLARAEEKSGRSCVEALYHFQEAGETRQSLNVIIEKGRELIFKGYGRELREYIKAARERKLPDGDRADLLTLQAELDITMGDWTGAAQLLEEALKLYRSLEKAEGMALAFKNLGGRHLRKGEADKAVHMFHESLALYQELDDLAGIAQIQNNLGVVHWQKQELEKAQEFFGKSLEIAGRTEDTQGIARSITNLGIIEFQQGNLEKAIEHYDRALGICEEMGDRKTLAQLCDNLGEAYRLKGERERAQDFFDRGIEIAEAHGFRLIVAQLYLDMSELLEKEEKESFRSQAQEIFKELGVKTQ